MDKNIFSRVDWILKCAANVAKTDEARRRVEDVQVNSFGYAEPGYDGDDIVLTGNWNSFSEYKEGKYICLENTMDRLVAILEKLKVPYEWSDEWTDCHECNKLVRTSPAGYGWAASYVILDDGYLVCHECLIREYADKYLESIEGCDNHCVTIDGLDLAAHGYVKVLDELENGLHFGQDADSAVIGKSLYAEGVGRYLFKLECAGPFTIEFSTWVHESEAHLLANTEFTKDKINGPSVAGAMSSALREASIHSRGA